MPEEIVKPQVAQSIVQPLDSNYTVSLDEERIRLVDHYIHLIMTRAVPDGTLLCFEDLLGFFIFDFRVIRDRLAGSLVDGQPKGSGD